MTRRATNVLYRANQALAFLYAWVLGVKLAEEDTFWIVFALIMLKFCLSDWKRLKGRLDQGEFRDDPE